MRSKSHNRLIPNLLCLGFLFLANSAVPVMAAGGGSIMKCQDDAGRWHYGDTAAEACERSMVTEMSGGGKIKREIARPPTKEELTARQEQLEERERLNKLAEKKSRKDKLLLSTYGNEKDIIYVRERKLSQMKYNIDASESTIKALKTTLTRQEKQGAPEENIKRTKAQIERHEAVVTKKRQEQENAKIEFDEQLERYRALKSKQAKAK